MIDPAKAAEIHRSVKRSKFRETLTLIEARNQSGLTTSKLLELIEAGTIKARANERGIWMVSVQSLNTYLSRNHA